MPPKCQRRLAKGGAATRHGTRCTVAYNVTASRNQGLTFATHGVHPLPGFTILDEPPGTCWAALRNDRGRWEFHEYVPVGLAAALPAWGEA